MANFHQATTTRDVMIRRLIARISDRVMQELTWLLHPDNEVELLECVGMGEQNFRINFIKRMWDKHHIRIDETVADATFFTLAEQVTARFGNTTASDVLDTVEEVTPPTELEIIDQWQGDAWMDDDARRALYGRDGSPQRELEIAKGEMRDELRDGKPR